MNTPRSQCSPPVPFFGAVKRDKHSSNSHSPVSSVVRQLYRWLVFLLHSNIDYVFAELMNQIEPALQKASRDGIEIRNIALALSRLIKRISFNVFFQDDEDKIERVKAMDEIKNRFGPNMITKVNTLHRVEGNTHFLDRNV